MSEANIPVKPAGFDSKKRMICLYGAAAVGKTTCLATLLKNAPENRRLVLLMTERNSAMGFEAGLRLHKIVPKPGQVYYVAPPKETQDPFANMVRAVNDILTKEQEKKHTAGSQKYNTKNYTFYLKLLESMADFKGTDYATGELTKVGSFHSLGPNDIIIIDGLSAMASSIWEALYGDVLLTTVYDYGQAQVALSRCIGTLSRIPAHVIILAHEKEYFQGQGLDRTLKFIGPDTKVGEATFESLMGMFTDVIRANKFGTKYIWETKPSGKPYVIAREGIPVGNDIPQDFSQLPAFKEVEQK